MSVNLMRTTLAILELYFCVGYCLVQSIYLLKNMKTFYKMRVPTAVECVVSTVRRDVITVNYKKKYYLYYVYYDLVLNYILIDIIYIEIKLGPHVSASVTSLPARPHSRARRYLAGAVIHAPGELKGVRAPGRQASRSSAFLEVSKPLRGLLINILQTRAGFRVSLYKLN